MLNCALTGVKSHSETNHILNRIQITLESKIILFSNQKRRHKWHNTILQVLYSQLYFIMIWVYGFWGNRLNDEHSSVINLFILWYWMILILKYSLYGASLITYRNDLFHTSRRQHIPSRKLFAYPHIPRAPPHTPVSLIFRLINRF